MKKTNLFDFDDTVETKYSVNVGVPQYLPKNECPKLWECYSIDKYNELVREINQSNVTDEEKEFLKFAATRHIVFTYSKVADYYAHATKEMQELMEKSALVIIDFNDAVANGYVELSDRIKEIVKSSEVFKEKLVKYNLKEEDI